MLSIPAQTPCPEMQNIKLLSNSIPRVYFFRLEMLNAVNERIRTADASCV